MSLLRKLTPSNSQESSEASVPSNWKCSECGKREGYFNYRSEVCSVECARRRKTRLQKEARHTRRSKGVTVKFKAHHSGS
jgi:hypothetical protein